MKALLIASIIHLLVLVAWSQEPAQAPLRITSDRLEILGTEGKAEFSGDVVARRDDVVLYAAKMDVYYHPETRALERIEASGDVRVVQAERVATAKSAVYEVSGRKILLTGDARVNRGADFIEGEQIELYLDEERSLVKGNQGQRVNAVFQSLEEPAK